MTEVYLFGIGLVISTAVISTVWSIGRIEAKALREARGPTDAERQKEAEEAEEPRARTAGQPKRAA